MEVTWWKTQVGARLGNPFEGKLAFSVLFSVLACLSCSVSETMLLKFKRKKEKKGGMRPGRVGRKKYQGIARAPCSLLPRAVVPRVFHLKSFLPS